jgi:lipopolysaccharide/colanic/teichoic acid biosynthesis glycosyltransferase
VLKEVLDRTIAFFGLLLSSPLLAVLAVVVVLDSQGPALYRRRVLGRGGKPFDAFKFRTMVVNGDAVVAADPSLKQQLEKDQKLKNDPRITRSGRWMRKLSLDELPQLFNVLRGEMSLVGPRMISPPELSRYGQHADELLMVKPGITGLWQVSGRSDLPGDDRVKLDIAYVRSRSIQMDIRLLFQTIPAVVKGRGAY